MRSSHRLPVLLIATGAVAAIALIIPTHAAVSDAQAAQLGGVLTPLGAEVAGNAEGTIPSWNGGLLSAPPCFAGAGSRYCDPFANEQALFTITPQNLGQHKDRLSEGQQAMFEQFQDYAMPVYPSRRTASAPRWVYAATRANALRAELAENGEALHDAATGIAFPIPQNGREVIWNHRTRYRGVALRRWNNQFAVTAAGIVNAVKFREDVLFNYSQKGAAPDDLDDWLMFVALVVTQPERLAGTILLLHEPLDPEEEDPRAWQFNPGQRSLRQATNIGYDNAALAADRLLTNDQFDSFSGAMDRYDWKLLGKQELFVPYNSYRLHSDQHRYSEILGKHHIEPALTRYELHRVWVVEARAKPGIVHVYDRRVFFVDEDSWQIVVADLYDRRGELWRLQETHTINQYDKLRIAPVAEVVYDLPDRRYLVQGLNNEDPEDQDMDFEARDFSPGRVTRRAKK